MVDPHSDDRHGRFSILLTVLVSAGAAILASAIGAFVTLHVTSDQIHAQELTTSSQIRAEKAVTSDQTQAQQQQSLDQFVRSGRQTAYSLYLADAQSITPVFTNDSSPGRQGQEFNKGQPLVVKLQNDLTTIQVIGSYQVNQESSKTLSDAIAFINADTGTGSSAELTVAANSYYQQIGVMATQMSTDLQSTPLESRVP